VATKGEEKWQYDCKLETHVSLHVHTKKHLSNGIIEGSEDGKWKSTKIVQHIYNNSIHSILTHCLHTKSLKTVTKQKGTNFRCTAQK
jgi:hypothetical protein